MDSNISVIQTIMNKLRRRGSDDPDLVPHERFDNNTVDDTWSPEASYTIEDAMEKIGFGRFQLRVAFYCGMAWIADSMEVMVLSILGPVLMCQWRLSSTEEALVTTVVFVGYLVGSPVFGYIGDTYGRRTALILSAAWAVYYGLLSALSPRYAWLLILRGLLGVGVSGVPQAVTYVSEFLPNKVRGQCIMTLEIFWACGTLLEVGLAMWILQSYGWHWWLAASAVPLMFFLAITAFFPESPRYQLARGDVDKAEATLIKIAKENRTTLPRGRLRGESHVVRGKFTDLFSPDFRRTTILLWIIWFVTAFSYYGIVLMSTEIINSETSCLSGGLGREDSCSGECKLLTTKDYTELLWTSFAELPGLFLTMLLIDRVGRKISMYTEYFAYSLVCFLLFICTGKIGLIILLFCARALISAAFQVAYVYTPEVYPTTIRGMALGSCSAVARVGCIMTPFVADVLLRASLHTAISVYAVSGVIAGVAAFLLPIETKGRSLQNCKRAFRSSLDLSALQACLPLITGPLSTASVPSAPMLVSPLTPDTDTLQQPTCLSQPRRTADDDDDGDIMNESILRHSDAFLPKVVL